MDGLVKVAFSMLSAFHGKPLFGPNIVHSSRILQMYSDGRRTLFLHLDHEIVKTNKNLCGFIAFGRMSCIVCEQTKAVVGKVVL